MVDIKDVLSFSYYTYKQPFTGSDKGKRYRIVRLEKDILGEDGIETSKETVFQVSLWKDYLSYENTPKEEMKIKEFDFSSDGLIKVVDWINEMVVE